MYSLVMNSSRDHSSECYDGAFGDLTDSLCCIYLALWLLSVSARSPILDTGLLIESSYLLIETDSCLVIVIESQYNNSFDGSQNILSYVLRFFLFWAAVKT